MGKDGCRTYHYVSLLESAEDSTCSCSMQEQFSSQNMIFQKKKNMALLLCALEAQLNLRERKGND